MKDITLALLLLLPFSASATIKKTLFNERGLEGVRYDIVVDGVQPIASKIASATKVFGVSLQGVQPYEGVLYKIGAPKLPVIRILVQGSVQVQTVNALDFPALPKGARIEPNLAPVLKRPGHRPRVVFNPTDYQSENFEPQPAFTIADAGSKNGIPLKLVTLHPLAYQAKTGELKFRKNFTVIAKRAPVRESRQAPLIAFIAGQEFAKSTALAAYVDFKKQQGFRVATAFVNPDLKTPAQIRSWLQKLLPTGLMHAVIIGDVEEVPSHKSTHIKGVTDHYYRAIDTVEYEEDINGPDIGVGRLSVQNDAQLRVVVQKLIRYQSARPDRNPDWLKQASFVATDDLYQVAEGSHNYVISNYTSKLGFKGSFPSSLATGGDRLYAVTHRATTNDLLQAFNQGRAIIDYSGHGSSNGWAGPVLTEQDVASLSHPDALPFVIANACDTGKFTMVESFGETWLRHPGAAIAYWGSFDSSYWDEDDILERKMFDGIFQFGSRELGEVTSYALAAVWNHYGGAGWSAYYWETYVLFGDPSLKLQLGTR